MVMGGGHTKPTSGDRKEKEEPSQKSGLKATRSRPSELKAPPAMAPPPEAEESTTPLLGQVRRRYGSSSSANMRESNLRQSTSSISSCDGKQQPVASANEPTTSSRSRPRPLSQPQQQNDPNANSPSQAPSPKKINWKRGDVLGKGTFGVVSLGFDLDTGAQLAVKEVDFPADLENDPEAQKKLKNLQREVNFLRTLTHPNIVQYLGIERRELTVCIHMEYVPGGSILHLLKKFGSLPETVAQKYTKQIFNGLSCLHDRGVIHRDIKGANVLVTIDGLVKLADFGNARQLSSILSVAQSLGGSPYWMSPEVIREEGHGTSADVWAVGATIIEMTTGKPPWAELPPVPVLYKIGKTNEPVPMPKKSDGFSDELIDLLQSCMKRNPHQRPTVNQLLDHPWVNPDSVVDPTKKVSSSMELKHRMSIASAELSGSNANTPTSDARALTAPSLASLRSSIKDGSGFPFKQKMAFGTETSESSKPLNSLGCITALGKRNSDAGNQLSPICQVSMNGRYSNNDSDSD
eukprot:TRINITY_DN3440_c0_g1_i1.p1 TRINITY_DN3440_c0_g1~~TRINITY_DN3440_c0_g1_i1.p1  ORF type:complete len:520 (+),score=113.07 TRINITY_DN3440_c0_g1_i1:59-1618(+)